MAVNYRDSYGEETETVSHQNQRMIYLLTEQNKLLASIAFSFRVLLGVILVMIVVSILLSLA